MECTDKQMSFTCAPYWFRLSYPQGHNAAGRVMSMKNSNDTIGNRTSDLPVCSAVPQQTAPPRILFPTLVPILPLRTVRPIHRTGVPLPSKCCILYIFSTNVNTEYFKQSAHSPFFSSKCRLFHNATFFGFLNYSHFIYRVC